MPSGWFPQKCSKCKCTEEDNHCNIDGRVVGGGGCCPFSIACGSTGDIYDLAGGTSGTSPAGVGVVITGTTEVRVLGLGCPGPEPAYSADMGAYCDVILGGFTNGPVTLTFTAPAGKSIGAVQFGLSNNTFGTNSSWTMTMTDTGGTATATSQSVTTSAFSPCGQSNGTFYAQAAIGQSITSAVVSFVDETNPVNDDYLAIGAIYFCLNNGEPDPPLQVGRIMESGGATRVLEDGTTYRLMEI